MRGLIHVPGPPPEVLLGSRPAAVGMLPISFNRAPECERPALLRQAFIQLGVRYDAEPPHDDPIEIDLSLRGLPGLQILSGRMQGARFRRTRVSGDPTDDVGLIVNPGGRHLLAQRGREIELGTGDATLVSLTDPLASIHRPPGDLLVLRFPLPQLAPRLAGARDRLLRRISRDTPPLKLLEHYVSIAGREPIGANRELQGVFVSHLYDLLAVTIGATRDATELARRGGIRAARLQAIKDDIAENIGRADLSVAALAKRHRCTERNLQRLFEAEGTTFTEYVLTQRLMRAHRMLGDPRHDGDKVSTLAYDCGFNDVSYFNRVFRRHYGASPSDVRACARAFA
jgi:AraC-like DNA-binding protein